MKRNILRLSILSVVVGLGLIAIAQARHGFDRGATDASQPAVLEADLPAGAPQPIAGHGSQAADVEVENPLRDASLEPIAVQGSPEQYEQHYEQADQLDVLPVAAVDEIPAAAQAFDPRGQAAAPARRYEPRGDTAAGPLPVDHELPLEAPPREAGRYHQAPAQPAPIEQETALPADSPAIDESLPPAVAARERFPIAHQPAAQLQRAAVAGEGTGRPGSKGLEGSQTPSLTLQKIAPAEIQVGKQCKFQIMVRNVGQSTAKNVRVQDEIPQGTRLVSTVPNAERAADGRLVWPLGDLEPGRDAKVELVLMPISEGEIGSVATVVFEAQASVRTKATRPELALRVTGPPKVMIGGQVRLQIELSNPGSGAATGVMLVENVPEGLQHTAGKSLEFEVGTLRAGESRRLDLVLNAERAGKVVNMITAHADANLEVRESISIDIIAPQLVVGLEGPTRRYLERPATYVLSVQNPGTAPARDIELTSYLPKGMKFVRANNAGSYDPQKHAVSWGLEELPAQQAGNVELVAVPVQSGQQELRVQAKSADGLTDSAEQTVSVEGLAAILFEVADVEDPIEVTGKTTYEIRVVNQGSKASSNVVVHAILPPDMKPITAEGPVRHQIQDGRVVFAPLERLAPKADTLYRLQVQALRAGDQRIRVQVMTDETKSPVTKEESTTVYSDQ